MRTNIDIDEALMEEARKVTGAATKKAAVEEGLRLVIRRAKQRAILGVAGKVAWKGDLDASREGRNVD